MDRKGTGTITFPEFESLHVFLASVEEEFKRLRADASGRVPVDEVVRMLVAQGGCGGLWVMLRVTLMWLLVTGRTARASG